MMEAKGQKTMARIRTIKPEFPQSESMGRVSRNARLLFVLLWTLCDDSGRTRGNSRMLASLLFPYDDDAPGLIDGWIAELQKEACIERYAADGSTYIEITNWLNHQKIDKPSPSKIPAFVESSRILANPRERSSVDQGVDQGVDQYLSDCASDLLIQKQKPKVSLPKDFVEFWNAYPKKEGKLTALAEWKKQKPDLEIVLSSIKQQSAGKKWRDGYILLPTKWLKEQRWNDEVQPALTVVQAISVNDPFRGAI